MNPSGTLQPLRAVLIFTDLPETVRQMEAALYGVASLQRQAATSGCAAHCAAMLKPALVMVDFACSPRVPCSLDEPSRIVAAVRRASPEALVIGVGDAADTSATLRALRAGVADFIDIRASAETIRDSFAQLRPGQATASGAATLLAVQGARIGVGTSTLCAHLAASLAMQGHRRVALLDLGVPTGDGLIYLDASGSFDFIDAVASLTRLDETLVRTALATGRHGVAALPLPHDLNRLRSLSHTDALALIDALAAYFDAMVIDLGGFHNVSLTAQIVHAADMRLIVSDQAVASLVSLSDCFEDMKQAQLAPDALELVINRYDASCGPSAAQITERFGTRLAAVLPERRRPLAQAAHIGRLLSDEAPHDPYMRALHPLLERLTASENRLASSTAPRRWLSALRHPRRAE